MNFQANFVFDQSDKIYHPGEIVSGTIIVSPLRSFTAYRFEVNLKCANTKIPIIDESMIVETITVGEQSEIVLGESYKFPFSFVIPNSSPETYIGQHFNLIWIIELSVALDRRIQQLGAKIDKKSEEITVKLNPDATQRSILHNELSNYLGFSYQLKKFPKMLFGIGMIVFFGMPFVGLMLQTVLFSNSNSLLSMFCFFFPPLFGFMIMVSIMFFPEYILNKIDTLSTEAIEKQYESLKLTFQDQVTNFNRLSFFVDVVPKSKLINLKRIESTLTLKEQVANRVDTTTISTAYLRSKRWKAPVSETLTAGVPWSKEIHLDLNKFKLPNTFSLGGNALKWELAVKLITNRQNPIVVVDLDVTTVVTDLIEKKIKKKLDQLPKYD